MQLDNLNLKTFRDGVYEALKLSILRCEIAPGQRLVEKDLISKIGTSRTPIREALIKLQQEGLVEKIENKGSYFVSPIKRKEAEEVLGVREILEKYCIDLAVDRIRDKDLSDLEEIIREEREASSDQDIFRMVELDTRFHEIIYRASGNQKLYEILNNLRNNIFRYRVMSFKLKATKNNHKEFFLAIKRKDKRKAKKLIENTISKSRKIILAGMLPGPDSHGTSLARIEEGLKQ